MAERMLKFTTVARKTPEKRAAAERSGHRLLYGENLAYAPVVTEFIRRVRSLGTLSHLEVRAINPLPTWGGFTTDEWGGGALFDLGVHPLAVALLAAAPAVPRLVQARLDGSPSGRHRSDEVAEVDVDLADPLLRAEQLDPAGAVDQVEERQLAHVAACHHPAGEPTLGRRLGARLDLLGLAAHVGDRVAVGEALRRRHGRRIIHARGPPAGV